MDNTTTSMIFRIETDLKKAFEQVAGNLDLTASQMLRAYVRYEVEKYAAKAQGDLFKAKPAPTPTPQNAPEGQGKARRRQKRPTGHV